jgi:hypothetical protein
MRRGLGPLGAVLCSCIVSSGALAQEPEYQFDVSEIERKPYQLGGFIEVEPILFGLDPDAALYHLRFPEGGETLRGQSTLGLRLDGSVEKGIFSAFAQAEGAVRYEERGWSTRLDLLEGYVTLKPRPGVAADAGKKVTKWGTGYFRNAVAFVDRPKDPEDPEEPLEGFYVLSADLIKSFEGPLRTVALNPVLVPVTEDINRAFGAPGHINVAGRLYLLLWDTDVDLLFSAGGSRATRFGVDFSRNLQANFEVHGELAWLSAASRFSLGEGGELVARSDDVVSALAGLRYLTSRQLTLIAEYYRNGTGIGGGEVGSFVRLVEEGYEEYTSGGGADALDRARAFQPDFAGPNPMRDYLFLRASQKEPFGILYWTPAVSLILNLGDRSFFLAPEIQHRPSANLVLRLRAAFLVGDEGTQYGEKASDYRLEARLRLFF